MIVIGHRGAARRAPENTLAGLHYAGRFGIKQIECDISVAADDVAVVFHDDSLARLTGRPGTVLSQTAAQLAQYVVHGPEADGPTTIPDAISYLNLAAEYNLFVHLEIKVHDREVERVVSAAVRAIEASRLDPQQIRLSSFSWDAIMLAQRRVSDCSFALAAHRFEELRPIVMGAHGLASVHLCVDGATQAEVDQVHAQDLPVYYYTVNSVSDLHGLDRKTIDGVFSDDPLSLVGELSQ